jgi:hypothetical protein
MVEVVGAVSVAAVRLRRLSVWSSVITSQGPGTTIKFALTIVQHLCGLAEASKVADGLLVPFP